MASLPKDPFMLLSVVNTALRDRFPSLSALCDDYDVDPKEITDRLAAAGYRYDEKRNQFI